VLVLCSRGSMARTRHLMNDWRRLMPHSHSESKFEKSTSLVELNEVAELANCTRCLYFEGRKRQDVYLWLADVGNEGPSVKFLVHNTHTMAELSMQGNCLKGSRPVLAFDPGFEEKAHLKLVKEMLKNVSWGLEWGF
jgi:ribosome biogenesis protein BRX1